jgi:hypothetical protein
LAKRIAWRRRGKRNEDLLTLLDHLPRDPEHKRMRAWYKQEEKLFRRVHSGPYRDWIEENFGPIENADESWLTPTVKKHET